MRLKNFAVGFALYLGAVAVGLGSAWWVLKKAPWINNSITVGAWKTNLLAGSTDAGMYTRASIALNALLALGRDETIYFIATHDDAGKSLRAACSYKLNGTPPSARWWSITAYADDLFLFDAPNQHYSLNGSTAQLDAKGNFTLVTGPTQPADPAFWLPTNSARKGLVLALRLYNPAPQLQAAPESLVPPSITAIGDCP